MYTKPSSEKLYALKGENLHILFFNRSHLLTRKLKHFFLLTELPPLQIVSFPFSGNLHLSVCLGFINKKDGLLELLNKKNNVLKYHSPSIFAKQQGTKRLQYSAADIIALKTQSMRNKANKVVFFLFTEAEAVYLPASATRQNIKGSEALDKANKKDPDLPAGLRHKS